MAVFAQFFMGMVAFHYSGCLVFLAFGVFMFAMACVKNMKNDLKSINKMTKVKIPSEKMRKRLSHFIWTHATVKQLSG